MTTATKSVDAGNDYDGNDDNDKWNALPSQQRYKWQNWDMDISDTDAMSMVLVTIIGSMARTSSGMNKGSTTVTTSRCEAYNSN